MGDIVGPVLGYMGAKKQASATRDAAQMQADAALQAAEMSRFRPVGITTGFGSSQFTTDAEGNVTGAGYTLTPELASIRDRLISQAGAYRPEDIYSQTTMFAPTAQSLFGLGQQLIPTGTSREASPEALALAQQYRAASQGLMPTSFETQASPEAQAYAQQLRGLASQVTPTSYDTTTAAQRYTQQQQELLAPGREQQLANVRNRLFQTGRTGLATGGTSTGLQATNPEMAAYYNALAQQDKAIAAGAEQQARANLAQDIGLGTQLGAGALSTQQQAEQVARQNMLQNLGLSLGYGTQGYTTGATAEDLARARYAQDIGLGTGLFSSSAGILGQIPALTSAAYSPLQTQLGLGGSVEQLGQQALELGSALGGRQATAGAAAGNLLSTGSIYAGRTLAGITDPTAALLGTYGRQITSGMPSTSQVGKNVSNWFNNLISPTPYSNRGTIYSNEPGSYTEFDY